MLHRITSNLMNLVRTSCLYVALKELDPDSRRIMELYSIGKSEREIAADIGLSQKAIKKLKIKIFSQLQERLKNFI